MTSRVLAIIPARGGSKGLRRKNIALLGGKPLLVWTIEASLESSCVTETVVSSEDDVFLEISRKHQANTMLRPGEISLDETPSEDVVRHVLLEYRKKNIIFDFVILLQPTSPLRSGKDIDNAFRYLIEKNALSLISVFEIENKFLKLFMLNAQGYIEGAVSDRHPFKRRQDLPPAYLANGAVYISQEKEFLKTNSFMSERVVAYLMSREKSIDIDNQQDLDAVEKSLS